MNQALSKLDTNEDRFVSIYQAVHKTDREQAQQFFEVEKFNFGKQVTESQYLSKCSPISVAGTFLEVISNGLSFESSANHVYLIPRGNKMTYSYAAQGLIFLCTAAGSIKDCAIPTIVYEGDDIKVTTEDGETKVSHSRAIPRQSKKILGGYTTITLPNDEKRMFWMGIEDIDRLVKYSAKASKGKANQLYTSGTDGQIDEGFFRTKITKSALKNFRRKKTLNDHDFDDESFVEDSQFNTYAEDSTPFEIGQDDEQEHLTNEIEDATVETNLIDNKPNF